MGRGTVLLKGWIFLSCLAAMVLSPAMAWADPPGPNALPVHVVSVKSDDAFDQAEALTLAIRKAVRDSKGWSLADSRQSLEYLALKMGCADPIDAACEARIAEVLKADRFLWAVITFEDDSKTAVTGTLNFFVRGEGTKKAPFNYSANLDDANADALVDVARTAVDQVTGGPPKGTLKVSAGGVAGQLFIDGEPVGALAAEGGSFPLASGEHRVLVKAAGYSDAEATATVKPSKTVEVNLSLVPIEEAPPTDLRMIGGFTAIGLGLAAGGVGLWGALQVNDVRNDETWSTHRSTVPQGTNACDAAQAAGNVAIVDQCDKAATMEIIQAVSFPVAGVAVGVGVYLLGTSSLFGGGEEEGDTPSAFTITPIVSPEVQAMSVQYRF